jgi:sodium/pantothenate symporter
MHILDPDVTPAAAVIIETLLPRFHPLLVGFVSGALMGAVISTTSSVLIYMGFAISRDLYQRIINPNIDEAKALLIARIAMALVIIITSFFAIRPPDGLWWIVTYANGILVSGWAPAILLGFEWKNATKEGAIVSLVGGPLAYIIAMLKATTFPPILIGLIVGGLGHVIVSNLTLKKDDKALEVFNRVKNEPLAKHDLQKYMASEEGRQFLLKEYKSVRISSRIVLGIAIAYFSFLYFTIGINIPK